MHHFNLFFKERQIEQLRQTAYQADLSVAELLRRMTEHCLQQPVLNDVLPFMSGSWQPNFNHKGVV